MHTVRYRGNLAAADTSRKPSPNIWYDFPWHDVQEGVRAGVAVHEDFTSFNITPPTTEGNWAAEHGYAAFSSTGGTITAGTGQGGEIVLASDGDNEGASIRSLSTPILIQRGVKLACFEARIKFSSIADTNMGAFVGLFENSAFSATVPIAAAGTLSDNNFVGFHRLEGDGDKMDFVYKANGVTQVTSLADAVSLAADTYVKVGFRFAPLDPLSGSNYLSGYSNNLRLAFEKQIPSAAGTDFPNDVGLGMALAVLNATGSSPGTMTVDWVRWGQLLA